MQNSDEQPMEMDVLHKDIVKEEVAETRKRFLLALYDIRVDTFGKYRYTAYTKPVARTSTKATYNLASLLPASATSYQHLPIDRT